MLFSFTLTTDSRLGVAKYNDFMQLSTKVSTSFRRSFSMERNAGKVYRDVFGFLVLFGGISRNVHLILIILRLSAIF